MEWKELEENKHEVISTANVGKRISGDAWRLWHDKMLKIAYTVTSGKAFYLIRKKLKNKEKLQKRHKMVKILQILKLST